MTSDSGRPARSSVSVVSSLVERLGYTADTKAVILSCDDLGASHASNEGVFRALHDGSATCASLMVPAAWACHAANNTRADDDIGVHLTLNSEHSCYRWGPVTHSPSLQSGEGGFPRTLADLWEHADPAEVLRELRAQVERAMVWGVDVTHLAPHLSAITLRPEFFDVYLELAYEYKLPIRLPSTISAEQAGFPFRKLAAEEGVIFPDHFDHDWRADSSTRGVRCHRNPRGGRDRDPRAAGDRHPRGASLCRRRSRWVDRRSRTRHQRRVCVSASTTLVR